MLHKSILEEKRRTASPNEHTERAYCAGKTTQDIFINICLVKQEEGSVVFRFPNARAVPGQGFLRALQDTQAKRETQGTKENNKYLHTEEVEAQQPTCTVTFSLTPTVPLSSAPPEPTTKPCHGLRKHGGTAASSLLSGPS